MLGIRYINQVGVRLTILLYDEFVYKDSVLMANSIISSMIENK